MKLRIVFDIIGTVLKIMGLLLLVPGFVSAYYHETSGISAFALTSLLSIGTGIILSRLGTKGDVGNKEAFAAVSLGWLAATSSELALFQGLGPVDALFESVSGFSATGATILVESNAQGYYIVNSTLVNNSISTALMNGVAGDLAGYNIAFQVMNSQTFYGLLFWRPSSSSSGAWA
jgi:trk system potassium uptake protein TrkH